ncbi:hypothetical protein [Massilia sp. 9I]|uniref:hypothetical protein n=1 Tax=Massilia sp. 9I TaxID=2653152 RepID=UPI0012F1FB9F|nr:hypothetical protein [Massilia sp. 9I]VXC71335.1 conserved hypothetical protein [Massilia sp. 9I]
MFIKAQQHPDIEFNPAGGQTEPTLVHHFSNRGDPSKSVLPVLAGAEGEQVLVVQSPLAELVDWTIQLHAHPDFPGRAVVDQKHRAFFEAVKASLDQVTAKLEQIEYVALDDD